MTHDRLATRKWKVPSDISESKSMTRWPSLSKWKSEMSGQSRHALPDSYRRFVPQADVCSAIGCVVR
jgi:hypothetical protein